MHTLFTNTFTMEQLFWPCFSWHCAYEFKSQQLIALQYIVCEAFCPYFQLDSKGHLKTKTLMHNKPVVSQLKIQYSIALFDISFHLYSYGENFGSITCKVCFLAATGTNNWTQHLNWEGSARGIQKVTKKQGRPYSWMVCGVCICYKFRRSGKSISSQISSAVGGRWPELHG